MIMGTDMYACMVANPSMHLCVHMKYSTNISLPAPLMLNRTFRKNSAECASCGCTSYSVQLAVLSALCVSEQCVWCGIAGVAAQLEMCARCAVFLKGTEHKHCVRVDRGVLPGDLLQSASPIVSACTGIPQLRFELNLDLTGPLGTIVGLVVFW